MTTPNAAQMLRDDHKRMRGLLRQLLVLPDRSPEMEPAIAEQLFAELEIHARLEEEIFYPAVMKVAPEELRSVIQDSLDAHHEIDRLIGELRPLVADPTALRDRLEDLRRTALAHFEQEESETLPAAEWTLAKAGDEVLRQMGERRTELLAEPRYQHARPERAQDPHGGEQKRKSA